MPNNYVEEKLDTLAELCNENNPVAIRDFLRSSLTSAIIHGLELAEGCVAEETSMQPAILAGSKAGAGWVIGHNSCRTSTLTAISKIKENLR